MSIGQSMLAEFDNEMASTRKMIALVPTDKAEWKPHPKSMTIGRLATHLSELPGWTTVTLTTSELDLNPVGGEPYKATPFTTREASLEEFDKNVKAARAALEAATDTAMFEPWSLKSAGQTFFTMPKIAVIRTFVMNHIIHHRAQLQVCLRLHDIPVPGVYGPSADEAM